MKRAAPEEYEGDAGPLFDPRRLARRDDLETSKAAARACEQLSSLHRRMIVEHLRELDDRRGRTKDQIAGATRLESVAVARRMRELANAGLVEECGHGTLASGRPGTLWRALDGAREAAS